MQFAHPQMGLPLQNTQKQSSKDSGRQSAQQHSWHWDISEAKPTQVGSCVPSALTLQVSLQQVCSLQHRVSQWEDGIQKGHVQQLAQVWVPWKTNNGLEDLLEASIILAAKARILILLIVESEIVMHHFWSEALAILWMDYVILIYTCIFIFSFLLSSLNCVRTSVKS